MLQITSGRSLMCSRNREPGVEIIEHFSTGHKVTNLLKSGRDHGSCRGGNFDFLAF